jgi:hypothetical protein
MTKPRRNYFIESIEVYGRDVVVKRKGKAVKREIKRGEIAEFSDAARKRLAFVAANTSVLFCSMATLTYPMSFPSDGKKVKHDLNLLLKRIKRIWPDYSYLWFLEFQRRGAPHIHLLTTIDDMNKKWLSASWYKIVKSGDPKHLVAGTRFEILRHKGAWYALKYAAKMEQKFVPKGYRNVGRFFGYSVDVKPEVMMVIHEGDISQLFGENSDYKRLVDDGYSVIFKAADTVALNHIKGIAKMEQENEECRDGFHDMVVVNCAHCHQPYMIACNRCGIDEDNRFDWPDNCEMCIAGMGKQTDE